MMAIVVGVLILAITIALLLPVDKANLRDIPLKPKPDNSDIDVSTTICYAEIVPYFQSDEYVLEE